MTIKITASLTSSLRWNVSVRDGAHSYLRSALWGSGPLIHHRGYLILRTVLNPRSARLKLPVTPPSPPKSVILLTTPQYAVGLTKEGLAALSNDGNCTVLAAAVDSLPGAPGRAQGHSWLITSRSIQITIPPTPAKSLSFNLRAERITVPLANTLFHTGTPSTIAHIPKEKVIPVTIEAAGGVTSQEVEEFAHAQQDIKEAWEELGELTKVVGQRSGIVPPQKEHERGCVDIVLPSAHIEDAPLEEDLPLRSLTFPRRIEAGMGNILKQVSSEPGAPQGASKELEEAVQEYISSVARTRALPGKLPIFARLTPHSPTTHENPFTTPGAHIHRVLSGGGGWGNKASLLSLDPQSEPRVREFAENFESGDGIVKVGEYVQFFVAEPLASNIGRTRYGIRFGCVPRIEELAPDQAGEEIPIGDLFGASSEDGVWVADAKMDVPFGFVGINVMP